MIAAALKTGECNACMKRIVAAPTAGASGVLPAVLLPLQARDGLDDETMVQALYAAAGFGQVIATRASISGAEGGCQAEVGSASGMAAAALVSVMGGPPGQMAHACAMALSNTLGLVCDPVAGLVEVPCVNRNVMGATPCPPPCGRPAAAAWRPRPPGGGWRSGCKAAGPPQGRSPRAIGASRHFAVSKILMWGGIDFRPTDKIRNGVPTEWDIPWG